MGGRPRNRDGFLPLVHSHDDFIPTLHQAKYSDEAPDLVKNSTACPGGMCMACTFSLWNTSLFYTNVASAAMIRNTSPL
jgi:drug/metabolite transporter (DMT)-like permease